MKLLTKKDLARLPDLYSQETEEDPIVYVKLFHPLSNWEWYIMEIDKTSKELCYGYVKGLENELGYFNLAELKEVKIYGLGIERDRYFKPVRLSKLKND